MKHETAVTFIGCLFIAIGCNTSDALLGSGDAGPAEGAVTTGADAAGRAPVVEPSDALLGSGDAGPAEEAVTTGADAAGHAPDGGVEPSDAGGDGAPPFDGSPSLPVLATFEFVVNGVIQTPMSCPSYDWEFPFPSSVQVDAGFAQCGPPCPGVASALLINTGPVAIAYIAATSWAVGAHYAPGVLTGDQYQLAGVLDPGDQVDITSVFEGAITALLGSSEPFSYPDASYASDEGTIPWPGGVSGSNGSAQMWVAQMWVAYQTQMRCGAVAQVW